MKTFFTVCSFIVFSQLFAQVTFNKRVHFGFPVATLTSIIPTDSCYYGVGILADSIPPYKTSNIFAKFDLQGAVQYTSVLKSMVKTYETWQNSLIFINDTTLAVAGESVEATGRTILIHYNIKGDTLSTREYPNPFHPAFSFMQPRGGLGLLPDGGFIISNWIDHGDPFVDPNSEVYVLRTDSLGQVQWDTVFEDPTWDRPTSLVVDGEGNTILGWVSSNTNTAWTGLESRARLAKVDPSGSVLWEYTTPESDGLRDAPNDMVLLDDGSLVIASGAGTELEHPAGNRIKFEKLLFKLSPDHDIEWEIEFPDVELNGSARLTNVIEVSDGSGFVTAGMEGEDLPGNDTYAVRGWLAKVSPNGTHLWTRRYVGIDNDKPRHEVYDLKECPDGGIILVGESRDGTFETSPSQQAWLLKLDEHGCLVPGCHLVDGVGGVENPAVELAVFPNPARDYLNFQLKGKGNIMGGQFQVVDARGRTIKRFPMGRYARDTFIMPVWDWATGVYFLQYLDGNSNVIALEKFIISQ